MILLAAYQVIARNFFDTGLLWGDALVRVLVLWVTFVGATIASRNDEHIRIDLLTRFTGERSSRLAGSVPLALHRFHRRCVRLVQLLSSCCSTIEDGIIAFAAVPAWICELVMPVGGGAHLRCVT